MREIEFANDRSIWVGTNNDANIQSLIILVPQWSKASLVLMSEKRQLNIWDQFTHEVGLAWEKVLREEAEKTDES